MREFRNRTDFRILGVVGGSSEVGGAVQDLVVDRLPREIGGGFARRQARNGIGRLQGVMANCLE